MTVQQYLTANSVPPMLVFVAQYVQAAGIASSQNNSSRDRIDYRAVLDPEQFALFSRLRDKRKQLAEREGLPVYTIVSNAQLAQIVQTGAKTVASLEKIDGLGEARIRKYGQELVEVLAESLPSAEKASEKMPIGDGKEPS